ncbi:hypothetical protein M0R45_020995 [Rubus argutus]|uniref:2-oxoacid dehydrogenase acyltransferase catalytic domain-containing protein n=1 Tax=Rubus argutus TaxID=59490 RepID=A0AAW1XBS1_RUBAR
MAISKYPLVNSCFTEESLEVILKGCHNIGIAMATPYGLVCAKHKERSVSFHLGDNKGTFTATTISIGKQT